MKLSITTLLLVFYNFSTGQVTFPRAIVSTIIGKAEVIRERKTIIIKQRDQIFDTDILIVNKSCKMTLLDKNNKYLEVYQPGKYNYKDLEKKLNSKPTGITEKFFHLVWEELVSHHHDAEATKKKMGKVVGGASRGDNCDIIIQPITMTNTSNDSIKFTWHSTKNTTKYQFNLFDSEKNELINVIIKDTSLVLLKKSLIDKESISYFWSITPSLLNDNCKIPLSKITLYTSEKEKELVSKIISVIPKEEETYLYHLKISEALAKEGWFEESYRYLKINE